MRVNRVIVGLASAAVLAVAIPASADQLTVTASGPGDGSSDLAAEAIFCIMGNMLTVQLTNTSADETLITADVLTGVFFNISGNPDLTPVSAVLADGSSVLFPRAGDGTDMGSVGGEWAYRGDLDGTNFGGATNGISSVAIGEFDATDVFPDGDNLQGPESPNGIQYGIVSEGGVGDDAVILLTGRNALIDNSVIFKFTFDGEIDIDDIVVTGFQYGKGTQNEPFVPPPPPPDIPEPATVGLMLVGLAGIAARRVRGTKS